MVLVGGLFIVAFGAWIGSLLFVIRPTSDAIGLMAIPLVLLLTVTWATVRSAQLLLRRSGRGRSSGRLLHDRTRSKGGRGSHRRTVYP
jgi:hypothetical protein